MAQAAFWLLVTVTTALVSFDVSWVVLVYIYNR